MRRRRRHLEVSTFPFLAVLLCTMGSLILLLLVLDRRAKIVAQRKAKNDYELVQAEKDSREQGRLRYLAQQQQLAAEQHAEWERRRLELHSLIAQQNEELAGQIQQIQDQITTAGAKLQAEQTRVEQEKNQLKLAQLRFAGTQQAIQAQADGVAKVEHQTEAAKRELERQAVDLMRLEQTLANLKALRERQKNTYSLVPYLGRRGDNRRPVYVECAGSGVIFHPDQAVYSSYQFKSESLRSEVEKRIARQQALTPSQPGQLSPRPYLLLLVRPDGITNYYRLQEALAGMKVDFGYEFIEPDWALDFAADDNDAVAQPWMTAAKLPSQLPTLPYQLPALPPSPPLPPSPKSVGLGGLSDGRPGASSGGGSALSTAGQGTGPNTGAVGGQPGGSRPGSKYAHGEGLGSSDAGGASAQANGLGSSNAGAQGNGLRSGIAGAQGNGLGSSNVGGTGLPSVFSNSQAQFKGTGTGVGASGYVGALGWARTLGGGGSSIFPAQSTGTGTGVASGSVGAPGWPQASGAGGPGNSPAQFTGTGKGVAGGGGSVGALGWPQASGAGGPSNSPAQSTGTGTGVAGGGSNGAAGSPQASGGGDPSNSQALTKGSGTGVSGGGSAGAPGTPQTAGAGNGEWQPGYSPNGAATGGSAVAGQPGAASTSPGAGPPGTGAGMATGSEAAAGASTSPGAGSQGAPGSPGDSTDFAKGGTQGSASPGGSPGSSVGSPGTGSRDPNEIGSNGGFGNGGLGLPQPLRSSAKQPSLAPAPPPPLGRLLANRDWPIYIECKADAIVIKQGNQRFSVDTLSTKVAGEPPLLQAIKQMIARRQATLSPGEPPYRPLLRFQVRPDGLRCYYLAYPQLDPLRLPMARENLESP